MILDVAHCLELQQLLFLDANAETGVGFDQDFVKPKGVNPDVFHQASIGGDHRWIGAGDAMQDVNEASLQLLLIGSYLAQHHQPFDPAKVCNLSLARDFNQITEILMAADLSRLPKDRLSFFIDVDHQPVYQRFS